MTRKRVAELMREYKRSIDKSTREIERERTKLQNQEKKVIADIKKAAKDGQMVRELLFEMSNLPVPSQFCYGLCRHQEGCRE